jgi:glycosyltransferase involved in cell wall biosynthesis
MSNTTLFIGNYLSETKGTTALAVRLKQKLHNDYAIRLVSPIKNQGLRLLHMLWVCLTGSYARVVIDTYSGPAFQFARISSWLVSTFRKKPIHLMLRGGNLVQFTSMHTHKVKRVLARVQHLHSPSQYLQHYFKQLGYSVHVLPNFIDLAGFPFQHQNYKPYSLLWVRAFKSIYHPDLPIRILHQLVGAGYEATLTMVGPDDGLLEECKLLAQQLQVTRRIRWVGPVPHNELPSFYQTHDVFLNTTAFESFGNAVMEAASSGIPFVSAAVGELPFIWKHEETAMLVEGLQEEEYVKAIRRLWDDRQLYQRLSVAARKNSEQYSWEHIQPKWEVLLNQKD